MACQLPIPVRDGAGSATEVVGAVLAVRVTVVAAAALGVAISVTVDGVLAVRVTVVVAATLGVAETLGARGKVVVGAVPATTTGFAAGTGVAVTTAGEMGVRLLAPGPAAAIQKRAVPALRVKICTWYSPPEGDANCQNRSPTAYELCVPRPTGIAVRSPPAR